MRKRDTVEQDLKLGPIKQEEIFFKDYGNTGEVHILVNVYKYRIFVGQFDTTACVWELVGEAFHSIEVEASRFFFERDMKVSGEQAIIAIIKEKFPGPNSVETFSAFCRERGYYFSIHEGGPVRDDLVRKYEGK